MKLLNIFKRKPKTLNENTIENDDVIKEKVKQAEEKNGISSNRRLLDIHFANEIANTRHVTVDEYSYTGSPEPPCYYCHTGEVKFIDLTKEGIENTEDYQNLLKARAYKKEYKVIEQQDCNFEIDYKEKVMYVVANGFCIEKQIDGTTIQVKATEKDIYRTIIQQEDIDFFDN